MSVNRQVRLAALVGVIVSLGACSGSTGSSGGTSSASPPGTSAPDASIAASAVASAPAVSSAASRPSSPAVIAITSPAPNAVVSGPSVHVVISLDNAQIVSATTTNIRPDQGHVHLYVDNVLVSMNYALEQDLPVNPGTYLLKAEFVAADHAPFNPRVWSPEISFTVK